MRSIAARSISAPRVARTSEKQSYRVTRLCSYRVSWSLRAPVVAEGISREDLQAPGRYRAACSPGDSRSLIRLPAPGCDSAVSPRKLALPGDEVPVGGLAQQGAG